MYCTPIYNHSDVQKLYITNQFLVISRVVCYDSETVRKAYNFGGYNYKKLHWAITPRLADKK